MAGKVKAQGQAATKIGKLKIAVAFGQAGRYCSGSLANE
jgi:hypothetical protein